MKTDGAVGWASGFSALGHRGASLTATLLATGLGVLGVASGAVAARVAEFRLRIIAMSARSLGMGHYFAYRRLDVIELADFAALYRKAITFFLS